MVKKSINSVNKHISLIINNKFIEIINQIEVDYNINLNIDKYNKSKEINSFNEFVNDKLRCQAKVKSGCQCKRSKKNQTLFCKIHQKKQKFGMINYKHLIPNTINI
tara:strand:- start:424 stop:741 length:318 start_codon:yes stop_codon:yes gene_type:complete